MQLHCGEISTSSYDHEGYNAAYGMMESVKMSQLGCDVAILVNGVPHPYVSNLTRTSTEPSHLQIH